jgi:hypothetical protein
LSSHPNNEHGHGRGNKCDVTDFRREVSLARGPSQKITEKHERWRPNHRGQDIRHVESQWRHAHHASRQGNDRAQRAKESPNENATATIALEKASAAREALWMPSEGPYFWKKRSKFLAEPK